METFKNMQTTQKKNISMTIHDDDIEKLPINNYIMKLVEQNNEFKQTIMELRKCVLERKSET